MEYELHITIEREPMEGTEKWIDFCEQRMGWKPLDIELMQGMHPNQLMMAARTQIESLTKAREWAHAMSAIVINEGFSLLRTKLEARMDKLAEAGYSDVAYWEQHMKLLDRQLTVNEKTAIRSYGIALSWNHLGVEGDLRKYFLTTRSKLSDPHLAAQELGAAYSDMLMYFQTPLRVEHEGVLLDTNPSLDEGWCKT